MDETRRILGLTVGWFIGVILAIAAIVVLILGATDFGWFVAGQNLAHQTQLEKQKKGLISAQNQNVQNQSNVQEGYVTAIENDMSAIDSNVVAMGANPPNGHDMLVQNIQTGRDECHYISLLTGTIPVDAQITAWGKKNCEFGTLKITSTVWKGNNGE